MTGTAGAALPQDLDALPEVVDAIVVGAGIGGLTAAYELTLAGLRPVLLEARGYTGGLIAEAEVGGLRLDIGAEAWAVRRPEVGRLVEELGLVAEPPAGQSHVHDADGRTYRIPARALLGLPEDPHDPDVLDALGRQAAERAAQDLTTELSAQDAERLGAGDLGTLVRERMGEAVLEKLVTPVAGGIHGAHPTRLSVGAVMPGLPQALAEEGSLARAVAAVRARSPQGPAVASVEGNMARLTATLAERVRAAGGVILTRHGAQSMTRASEVDPRGKAELGEGEHRGAWAVHVTPTRPADNPSHEPVPAGEGRVLRTSRVLIAGGATVSQRLLEGLTTTPLPELELTPGAPLIHLTLLVDSAALDEAPIGSGILVAPEASDVQAKALTHLTIKWPSLGVAARELGRSGQQPDQHLHALRLSYGRAGQPMPQVDLALALADASRLTGVDLDADCVRGHKKVHWGGALAPATPQARATARALDAAVAQEPQLAGVRLIGAFVAGTGLAAIVPHAREAARALV